MPNNNQNTTSTDKPSLLTMGLNFYVSLALFLGSMPALANEPSIIADPGAPNRPDILKAPNETLIINIANPDSKGVSINEYSRFNTPPTGTILNNSNKNIDTKIAGQIDANYRLSKEASLIINKVNSAKKSSLKGNLEVAGSRADVLIANPNGISVDGLNMINSRSLTLTTGNINNLRPKEIELISNNSIDIVGDGLNDKSSDYTNVISNAINLNSNIHANELNIIGEKEVVSSSKKLYSDVKTKVQENIFTLDISALGGMYANKIKLVGTSKGVGINNNGPIIANNNIEISLDGDIVNSGAIASNKDARVEANTITNKDEALIGAKNTLNIKTDTLVNTSSGIYAKDINVDAKKLINNSSSKASLEKSSFAKNLALKQSGENRFKLQEVNLKEIKAKIEAKFKKLGKELSKDELNAEILKEAVNKDSTLYALNLHKDSYLYGTSSKVFANLRIDVDKNEVVLDTSKAKDREVLKRIYYSINKEILNEEDKTNFIPGSIVASNDINLKVDEVLNDKSFIYASNNLLFDSKDVTNVALNLKRDVNSFNEFKWKQQEWKKGIKKGFGKKRWVTKGGKGAVFNFSYTDVGLPAVFAAGNNIVGSAQNFSSFALNDDIKLANVDIDKFFEPLFNSPIIKNLNTRVKNQGYYYSLDNINQAFIANILDTLYEARNESISKFKHEAKDKNVKASALVMANNIDLDANISLAGSVVADNVNLNSQNLILNHLELNSKDVNLKASAANINSSDISAKNINIDANNINLDKDSSKFSKASNLRAHESLNLNAKENLNITGTGLEAKKINLNADNININAKEFAYSHSAKEKGISFNQSIQTLNSANLDAKDINLNSKSNTNISSSNLMATNKLNVEAGNDIYVVGVNTNESTQTKEKSKGFFSKKESHLMAINQKVISSNLNAYDISLKVRGNTIITGSNLSAKNDINIDANNISINPSAYESLEYSQTNKKGFGGFKRSIDMHSLSNLNLTASSLLSNSGNINLNANNDISIISSDIKSSGDVNLNAKNDLSILTAKEQSKQISIHKSSTFNPLGILSYVATLGTSGAKIYSANYNEQGTLDGISKLSNISAKDNINLNASNATIVANLSSDKNIDIKANQASIFNATNTHESYSISKSKSVSIAKIQDILKDIKPKSLSELKKDTSIKLRVADIKYKEATNNISSLKSISSKLNANNININTNDNISIKGTDLNAKEDINLISKNGNIYILNSTDTIDTTSILKEAHAALSLTAQNEYAQIAPVAIALKDAIKELENVKKEYVEYKKQKANLSSKLSEIKQRYKNKEPGINASDIEDLSDILDNIKDEEKYYITNIALATTNLASKTTALISQSSSAATSSQTLGFSLGVAANISGTKTTTTTNQTISKPSNLSALNINLTTNKDKDTSTNITGSNLLANNDININTKDLNINSSKDKFKSDEKSKALSGSAKFTMYGGGGGSLGLNHSQSNSYSESITNNNSKLISNKDININTTNDATIKGANLIADGTLNLKVGNNLSLESLRDKYISNQKDFSISAGVGFSGNTKAKSNSITTTGLFDKNHFVDINTIDKSSTNANFSRSRSNTITKQTILSSITANNLNVEVGKNTHLKGSLLASANYETTTDENGNTKTKFIDNHNLNLKTNTLSYENLSNTSYNKGTNFNIGANYSLANKDETSKNNQANNQEDKFTSTKSNNNQEDKFTGIKSINLSNQRNLSYTLSKTLATLGNGNIEIANKENSDDMDRLNKDTTKPTKDLVDTSISSNIDASIDTRLFTADGREQIKSEIKYVINKLDDFNRFVKDKISDELTSEQKEQIEQVGLKNSIIQALRKEGVSDEKINLLLNDENVRRLISDYENRNNVNASKPNNTNTHKLNNEIILKSIEVIAQKNFQDYLVDGSEAINSMVEIVGEEKAATAILVTQFATQGIVKTSVSMLMEKGKDTLFGGVKDKISNYISKDLFEVNDKGWQDKQKQAIYSLSDVSADFSIDLAISGPFALMKGAKNLGKANKKFDESLKENNVNSDTIVNSNAELKRNDGGLVGGKSGVISTANGIKHADSAVNVVNYIKYKDELLSNMGRISVKDKNLQNIIDFMYRPNAKIGSGSTADTVRYELKTGENVAGKNHMQKAQDSINALEKWIKNNSNANKSDVDTAQKYIKDLKNALNGN